jgi:glyoxylase I family protein
VPELAGYSHLSLTVTDVEASTKWWNDLLGTQVLMDDTDEWGIRFTTNMGTGGLIIGFRKHAGTKDETFDESRVGLDHFAIHVPSRTELEKWAARLEELGIENSGIKDMPYGAIITFRDPDNIQAEFFAMPGT